MTTAQAAADWTAGLARGEADARAEEGLLPTTPSVDGSLEYVAAYRAGRSKVRAERHNQANGLGPVTSAYSPGGPGPAYPSPHHVSYDEDSRWCQDHGHTGLLVGSVCGICDALVATDHRFANALAATGGRHNPDGSRAGGR
jgi:hypothetical protein